MIPPQLAMLAWIPFLLYLFTRFPAQKALAIGFIGAWLFLPQKTSFDFPGLPDYTRTSATGYGILLAALLFDGDRIKAFRLSAFDIPMLVWCLCPIASSITNNLGLYDGLSEALSQTVAWGIPYFLGRLYFGSLSGMNELAKGILAGGLLYIPLCLFEVRMSPQLHNIVYGFFPHGFAQTVRYGGWRPQVFMQHGLAVGLWMMGATLIGIWLWRAGAVKEFWRVPMSWLVVALLLTFVLLKSTGAWALMIIGLGILFTVKWFRTTLPVLFLVASIAFYLQINVSGAFDGDGLVRWLSENVNQARAESLEYRFDNEEILGDKARERIFFGWGGWGRNRVFQEDWKGDLVDVSTTDSFWIITFGVNGILGLASITTAILLPVAKFCFRYPASLWFHPKVAPAASMVTFLALYMVDNLVNAMRNPVYLLACGGLVGLLVGQPGVSKSFGRSRLSNTSFRST